MPDLGQALHVAVDRPDALGADVAAPEMRRVDLLVVDREHALDDERAVEVHVEHPGHEVDALEHHRPALVERALQRRLDADEHVARLVEEAEQRDVAGLLLLGLAEAERRLEARIVDRRHELLREEGAHRLPDEVGRGDARDAEAVGDLRGDRRLAGARAAADEQDHRQIELLEVAEAAAGA